MTYLQKGYLLWTYLWARGQTEKVTAFTVAQLDLFIVSDSKVSPILDTEGKSIVDTRYFSIPSNLLHNTK